MVTRVEWVGTRAHSAWVRTLKNTMAEGGRPRRRQTSIIHQESVAAEPGEIVVIPRQGARMTPRAHGPEFGWTLAVLLTLAVSFAALLQASTLPGGERLWQAIVSATQPITAGAGGSLAESRH